MKNQPSSRMRPFTLIELLVVIAIIAILAAMLLPALSRAKWQGKIAVTQNNYKQMAIGFITYAGDHDGQLPMHDKKGEGSMMETRNAPCNAGWDNDWRIMLADYGVLPATAHPITGAPAWTDEGNSETDFIRNPQQTWYSRIAWKTAPTRFSSPRLSQASGSSTLFMDWLRYANGSNNYYGVNYTWGAGGSEPSAPSGEASCRITWSGLVPTRFLTAGMDSSVRFTQFEDLEWYWGNAGYKHYYKPIEY